MYRRVRHVAGLRAKSAVPHSAHCILLAKLLSLLRRHRATLLQRHR